MNNNINSTQNQQVPSPVQTPDQNKKTRIVMMAIMVVVSLIIGYILLNVLAILVFPLSILASFIFGTEAITLDTLNAYSYNNPIYDILFFWLPFAIFSGIIFLVIRKIFKKNPRGREQSRPL